MDMQVGGGCQHERVAGVLHALRLPRWATHAALMVVDEMGYLPVTRKGDVLFFQVINTRYEHTSTVLTSNQGFKGWGAVFGDEVWSAAP